MTARELRNMIHQSEEVEALDEFTAFRLKKLRENQPKQ